MLLTSIFLISAVAAIADESQNDTAIALPMYRLPTGEESPPTANDLSDYQAFQRFKYLVYPNKFFDTSNRDQQSTSMIGSAFARNITIDEIQLPTTNINDDQLMSRNKNNMFSRRLDGQQQPLVESSSSMLSRHYPITDYQHEHHHLIHPNTAPAVLMYGLGASNQPNHFPSNTQTTTNMADPLFVMATLAFVAFLINSILGLVDRLNLLPLVRTTTKRRGKVEPDSTNNQVIWPERRDGDQSEEGVEALLRELESTIRAAFDHYEKCATEPNDCYKNPTKTTPQK